MNNHIENEQGGFFKLIILIIVALLLMKFFHITFSDVFNWIKGLFNFISK